VKPFLFLILCLFFSAAPAVLAVDTIQPSDASKHAGEEVYVEGMVASVHATPKDVAFINLNEAYPHRIFTGFIPNLSAVGDETWLNGLKGKTVRIHGTHQHSPRHPRDSDPLEGSGRFGGSKMGLSGFCPLASHLARSLNNSPNPGVSKSK
jgi:hypothetical protein